jgi:predicted transcriptional regulator of viral defense system
MPKLTRIDISKKDIVGYFNNLNPKTVFMKKEIGKILFEMRNIWRLSQGFNTENFIFFLTEKCNLQIVELYSPNYNKTITRYIWNPDFSIYQIALSIKPNSYFSHYTAVFMHGLTQQVPKTIYFNTEQSEKKTTVNSLTQNNIDLALKRKPRVSQYIFNYDNWKICCINGKYTDNLGVEKLKINKDETIPLTSIERTLIDISVRPVYSGGIYEVLNIFKTAKGNFSVNKLNSFLKKINYIYPYHQVIGFYLQQAGFQDSLLNLLKTIDMKYDFYLDYDIKNTTYIKEWRLFIPKDF